MVVSISGWGGEDMVWCGVVEGEKDEVGWDGMEENGLDGWNLGAGARASCGR